MLTTWCNNTKTLNAFLVGFIIGVCFSGLMIMLAIREPRCPKADNLDHHDPHPEQAYRGTKLLLTFDGMRWYHFVVETTGDETTCRGHDKNPKDAPCDQ